MAAAAAIHAVLLLLYFGAAAGAMVSGGAGADSGPAVEVSLASLAGGREQTSSQELAALYRKILVDHGAIAASDEPHPPSESLQSLMDTIDRSAGAKGHSHSASSASGENPSGDPTGADNAARRRQGDRAQGPAGHGAGPTSSAGGIWGEIEPCWRSLPNTSRVPVTLQVILDDAGRVSKPPQIVRPPSATLDEARLIAEARALAALAACVPYHSSDFLGGQRQFTVEFSTSKVG
jgi:hypothetical protein